MVTKFAGANVLVTRNDNKKESKSSVYKYHYIIPFPTKLVKSTILQIYHTVTRICNYLQDLQSIKPR